MEGWNVEPFPRGALVADAAADTAYVSEAVDLAGAKSVAYWVETYGSYPATITSPATAFVETSASPTTGNWVNLTPGGIAPNFGAPETGEIQDPLRWVRVRVVVLANETPTVTVRLVGRGR